MAVYPTHATQQKLVKEGGGSSQGTALAAAGNCWGACQAQLQLPDHSRYLSGNLLFKHTKDMCVIRIPAHALHKPLCMCTLRSTLLLVAIPHPFCGQQGAASYGARVHHMSKNVLIALVPGACLVPHSAPLSNTPCIRPQ